MGKVQDCITEFKMRYPSTVAWRTRKHAIVIESYLNEDEEVLYAFCAQKNDKWYQLFNSCVVVLTNKRILIGQKRVMWGSFYTIVTPELYNDMKIMSGLFWEKIIIDTVKEKIILSNIANKALDDIETNISNFIMDFKNKDKKDDED